MPEWYRPPWNPKAKDEIDAAAGTADRSGLEVWPLGLSSYASVKAFFARRAADKLDRIDALIEDDPLVRMDSGNVEPVKTFVSLPFAFFFPVCSVDCGVRTPQVDRR